MLTRPSSATASCTFAMDASRPRIGSKKNHAMLSLYRTLSLRYLSRRWFRAVLVVASIMLGVATLVATQALNETMSKATLAAGNPMAGTIDLIVTNGETPVDRELTKALVKIKGVKEAHAKVFDRANLVIDGKEIQV